MIKFLQLLQKLLTGFFVILIAASLLTWLGVINPFERFENSVRGDVEENLTKDATTGNAEAQNKLGTLLYLQAKKQKGDFSEAIGWLQKAVNQNHPIAQVNLAYAYKAGNGVTADPNKAIELLYKAGINFLRLDYPLDAKDCVYDITKINKQHPLKLNLVNAIKAYTTKNEAPS